MNSSSDSDKPMTPRSPRRSFDSTLLEHLQRCFNDPEKVFAKFRTRKLLNSIAGEKDETWLTKFDNYKEAILEAIPIHKSTCEACSVSIQDFRSTRGGREPPEPRAAAFCNDIIIYIDSYMTFLDLFGPRGLARRTLMIAREALVHLESEQAKSPRNSKVKGSPRESPIAQSAWGRMGAYLSVRKSSK